MQADKANGVFTCAHCGTLEEQPILVRDIDVGAPSDRPWKPPKNAMMPCRFVK